MSIDLNIDVAIDVTIVSKGDFAFKKAKKIRLITAEFLF